MASKSTHEEEDVVFKVKYSVFGGSRGAISASKEDVLPVSLRLRTVEHLKSLISESKDFKELTAACDIRKPEHDVEDTPTPLEPDTVGFFHPGHQFKGRKQPLLTEADMSEMYKLYPRPRKHSRARVIYIYADVRQHVSKGGCGKHGRQSPATLSPSATIMGEKIEVYESLRDKHKEHGYSDEQIHLWAYLLATKRHDSDEYPPAKRFFAKRSISKGIKRQEKNETEDVDAQPRPPVAEEPGKDRDRIMRQLKELCELRDLGGVTADEFSRERSKLAKALASSSV